MCSWLTQRTSYAGTVTRPATFVLTASWAGCATWEMPALQERRDAWRMCRTSISYKLQCRSLTLVRQDDPANLGSVNTAVERGALQRIDRAFAAFFRRCKAGGKPGYPRFRSRRRYTTIEVNDVGPNQVQSFGATTLVRINGLPTIRLVSDRQLPDAKPCAIRIVRRTAGCTVDLVYDEEKVALAPTGETVGVDVGTRKRFSLSTGEITPPIAEDWKAIRRAQRAVARCERASRGRRKCVEDLARLRRHEAVRRRNSCHVVTSDLVKRFDLITIEDLRIGNMTASAAGHRGQSGAEREGEEWAQPFDSPAGMGHLPPAARLQGRMGR